MQTDYDKFKKKPRSVQQVTAKGGRKNGGRRGQKVAVNETKVAEPAPNSLEKKVESLMEFMQNFKARPKPKQAWRRDGKQGSQDNRSPVVCWGCGEEGHYKNSIECPLNKPQPNQEPEQALNSQLRA